MSRGGPEALAAVPLFAGLSKRHLRKLAGLMEETRVDAGTLLAEEGQPGDTFYVLLEGEAKVRRGKRTIATLLPGDFFGEIALIDSGPRTATVVAETPLTVLKMTKTPFLRTLEDEPTIVVGLLEELSRRLRNNQRPLTA